MITICLPQNRNKKNNRKKHQTILKNMNEEVKMAFYHTQKLKPEVASLYQLVLPFPLLNLGYSYSNNWKKGMYNDIALIALIATRNDKDKNCWDSNCRDEVNDIEMGIAVFALFKVFQANKLVEMQNKRLFKKLFGVKKPNFSFNYRTDINSQDLCVSFPLN